MQNAYIDNFTEEIKEERDAGSSEKRMESCIVVKIPQCFNVNPSNAKSKLNLLVVRLKNLAKKLEIKCGIDPEDFSS